MDRKAICIAIGRNIRRRREESGISETALAFYLGVLPEVKVGVIYWQSLRLYERRMTLRTVDNIVSKIRRR